MNDNHNPAFQEWAVDYFKHHSQFINALGYKEGQRLGQKWVNDFVRGPWPELFYCGNSQLTMNIIEKWLIQHQYYDTIPTQMIYTQTQKD